MRIAIVLDYSLDLIGGAQRAALNEAAALVAARPRVLLVAPRPARRVRASCRPASTRCGRRARTLPALDFPLVADDEALRDASAPAPPRPPAWMRCTSTPSSGTPARRSHAARRLGLPVVHTVHTAYWPAVPAPLRPAARAAARPGRGSGAAADGRTRCSTTRSTLALAADVVVSPSAHQAATSRGSGRRRRSCCRTATPEPAPRCALPVDDRLRVAWVGRCVPEKRLLTFVRAVRLAQRRLPEDALRVAIAGDGLLLPVARAARRTRDGVPRPARPSRACGACSTRRT